jgi:NAD(P)-dependent dehydrogenase (short-subunit alcohol dehydrogenase family)
VSVLGDFLQTQGMEIDLGRTAFVSGSTQGIGRSIASRPAESGAAVRINGRDPALLGRGGYVDHTLP